MSEFKRLYSKKTLLLLAAVIIINMGLFIMSCTQDKRITLTGNELESYISEYPEFLENTKRNRENMSILGMYKSGFAADNIRKSAEAYAKLDDIKAEYGDNRGVVLLFQYGLTDILLMAFLMIMSLWFFSERKKGLVNLVRSTVRGRGYLYFQRIVILLLSALGIGILLYGGNFLGMMIRYGGGEMSRAIQSLPEFRECPYSFTIGGYFLLSCFLKITVCFASALAFFLAISVMGTAAAYTLTALTAVSELLLFYFIPSVSSFNTLKFINIFSVMNCIEFFSVCRNLNIFGKAVPVFNCNCVFMICIIVILISVGYIVHGKMYVMNKKFLEGIINKLERIAERISFQRTMFGWESYKLLVKQGGLFFIIAAFLLTLSSALKYDSIYPINALEKHYYEKYQGIVTSEVLTEAENEFKDIEEKVEFYQNAINELGNDKSTSMHTMEMLMGALNEAKQKRDALSPVIDDMKDGYHYTKRTGKTVHLIKPYTYDMLLNKDKQSCRRASLYILIGIIGAVSGVFAYDSQNNMNSTLRTSNRGRKKLTAVKIGTVFIVCAVLSAALNLIQVVQIGNMLGYNDINVPVQSLMFMRDFKLYISIREYLILLFVIRAIAAFAVGAICALISRLCADTMSAMGVSTFIIAVPAVFAEIIPNGSYFSCVYLISGEYFR